MSLKQAVLAAVVVGLSAAAVLGQMSIEPPAPTTDTSSPATQPSAPPATATTVPSASNVLEGLLKDKPDNGAATTTPPTVTGGDTPAAVSGVAEVAPTASTTGKANRIREGEFIWNRTGRLAKDEKTGNWYFSFESDGKNMQDPPMDLIPSKFLMAMEDASGAGTQPLRFKVSGQVTEYRGKNYLWVQHMEILRDLNKGIGG